MNVAVIGCGYWGKNLVRNFDQLDALRMVCDTTDSGRAKALELAPDAVITASINEVFSSDVSAIAIATPAETHFELVSAALEAGKDVFVEKPLALTFEQGNELVRIAEERKRILMVGHVLEYHPAILKLRELADAGELGKLRYIYSNRLSFGKIRREENVLWSFAPHDIAIILRLAGSLPFQVNASGGSYVQPNVTDVTVANLLFGNDLRAHIFVSWLHPFKEQRFVIVGENKMASFDDITKELVLYNQHVEIVNDQPVPVKGQGEAVPFEMVEPLRLECEAFLSAVRTRSTPLTSGTSGLAVLKVLQAAQRSLTANGEPVTLPTEAPAL